MPIDIIDKGNIYESVKVIVESKDNFVVYNLNSKTIIARNISSIETALAIKKAYCEGYHEGQKTK